VENMLWSLLSAQRITMSSMSALDAPERPRRDEWGDYVRDNGFPQRRKDDRYEQMGWPLRKHDTVELWPGGETRRAGRRPY
jgi:hypothetical protein